MPPFQKLKLNKGKNDPPNQSRFMSRSRMLSPGPGGSELEDHRIQPRVGPHRRIIPTRTSLPLPALPLLFVSDLAAKKGAHRNCNKNRRFACAGCQPPQWGKKRTSRRERQKRGAGYKSRANAALARSGGKYPEKFRNMGWMEEPEGIE